MINKSIKTACLITFLQFSSGVVMSSESQQLHGCYEATKGQVETTSFSQTQQLGHYSIVLKHKNWQTLSRTEKAKTFKRFIAKGELLGTINDIDYTAGIIYSNHVLTEKNRRGLTFTNNDTFVVTSEPKQCNNQGGYLLAGTETIHFAQAVGIFSNLDPSWDNTIELSATINSCTGLNDFKVISGTICFTN